MPDQVAEVAALTAKVDILMDIAKDNQKGIHRIDTHLGMLNGRTEKMEFAQVQHEMADQGHQDLRKDVERMQSDGSFRRGQWSVLVAVGSACLAIGGAVATVALSLG